MSDFHYEPLSYLDSSFLALESRTSHMHVAAVALFDASPLKGDDGGIDIERIRAHVRSKLQYIPRYRQRLEWVPYDRRPVWVDDAEFTFDYHVRHTSLPRPGSDQQLKELAGRIVSTKLDRTKPLWEMWVIEGMSDDRFALIVKIHHCMIDGLSGVDLTTILLNTIPRGGDRGDTRLDTTPGPNTDSARGSRGRSLHAKDPRRCGNSRREDERWSEDHGPHSREVDSGAYVTSLGLADAVGPDPAQPQCWTEQTIRLDRHGPG